MKKRFSSGSRPSQRWVVALLIAWLAAPAGVARPDLPRRERPAPEPPHPAAWDVFTPPVGTTTVSANAPAIAEWTRTAARGESVVLAAHGLFAGDARSQTNAAHFTIYGQTTERNGIELAGLIQRLDDRSAAVTLPSGLPDGSTYLLWPRTGNGYGHPIAINRTEAWWIGPEKATRGETVSIYGRNLSNRAGETSAWVYIKPGGAGAGVWAEVTAVNPYRVQFAVPVSLGDQACEVWVHNGHGGSYGWSGPISLNVTTAEVWDGERFNVRDHGARGDGATDDTAAIKAAYAAALVYRDRTGLNPTLYFPEGTYSLQEGIGVESHVRYAGDGMEKTFLRCGPGFAVPGPNRLGLIFSNGGSPQNIEVVDLSLEANSNFRNPANQDFLIYFQWAPVARDIRFTRVRVKVLEPGIGCGFFNNVVGLRLTDCKFIGGSVMLFNGRQHEISKCSFYGANDSLSAVVQRGVSDLSVTQCYAADLDINSATGQGLGRFLAGNGDYGTQRNIYIGENQTVDLAPRAGAPEQNSGEQVMFEGNSTLFEPTATGGGTSSVSFAHLPTAYLGETAVIVGGKGAGQSRRIVGADFSTRTITVSPAWNVSPDATSKVIFARSTSRCAIYKNLFDGKADYATRLTASAGIEPYGGCYDWIADGNTITHVRSGIYLASSQGFSGIPALEPCYFHYYANNTIRHCHTGVLAVIAVPRATSPAGMSFLGLVFRRNYFANLESSGMILALDKGVTLPPNAIADALLFEYNVFSNLPHGFDLDHSESGKLIRNPILLRNTFSRGNAPLGNSFGLRIGDDNHAALQDNSWIGFQSRYAERIRGGMLELPVRRVDLGDAGTSSAVVTIRNAGDASLDWVASTRASWLTLSATRGTVANENSESTITLTGNATGLPSGVHTETVTFTAGQIRKDVTVAFSVRVARPPQLRPLQVRVVEASRE